ncbi:MAG: hypothetical protein ACTHOP_12585 [Mesorhizobium sp.]
MILLETMTTASLLELQTDILRELRRREIIRSTNNPTGDYAELLFSRAMGWMLNSNSSADADALDSLGNRFQIKSRRLTKENPSRQLGFMRRLPDRPFDFLAAVLFDDRFRVYRAAIVPLDLVAAKSAFVAGVNAWRFLLRDDVWTWDGVVDATDQLRSAQADL